MRDTRTTKQKGLKNCLMLDLRGRKIGIHMHRIYEECGHAKGRELEDWVKAQSEVLRTLDAG